MYNCGYTDTVCKAIEFTFSIEICLRFVCLILSYAAFIPFYTYYV